jgi:hypothetical protein
MHYPCLDSEVRKGGEISLHQNLDGVPLSLVVELFFPKSGIVMDIPAGLF